MRGLAAMGASTLQQTALNEQHGPLFCLVSQLFLFLYGVLPSHLK
jgi:hypothetical protein